MDIQRSCSFVLNAAGGTPNYFLLVVILILIIGSAFFSMAEMTFSSVNTVRLRMFAEDGRKGAKRALEISENFNKTLTTLLVGNNIINITMATLSVTFFSKLLASNPSIVELVSTTVSTVIVLIFGEILPKTIAKKNPDKIALKLSFPIFIFQVILYPIVIIFAGIQRLLNGKESNEGHNVDEAELEVILDTMEETGTIKSEEVEMIQNILDLNDINVKDIMTPRVKIVAIDVEDSVGKIKEVLFKTQFSRIPVYKGDKDNIIGILYEREFFTCLIQGKKINMEDLIHPVHYVSKAMKVNALIELLKKEKVHIAIVSGEYGETAGIVTMEDALEELVGEIYDEHDSLADDELIKNTGPNTYLIDADIFLEDLFDDLELGKAPETSYAKLSGWLYGIAESIPEENFTHTYISHFIKRDDDEEYEEYTKVLTFTVVKVEDRRIMQVQLTIEDYEEEKTEEE